MKKKRVSLLEHFLVAKQPKPFFVVYHKRKCNHKKNTNLAGCVSPLMFRQIAGLCKPFVAHLTSKWFLASPCGPLRSGVGALMCRQITGCCKPFVADFARIRFLSSVGPVMWCQRGRVCEPFVTDFAHKWFLSSVGAVMSRQIVG